MPIEPGDGEGTMNDREDCRQTRRLWMDRFDGGERTGILPDAQEQHLDRCAACRAFISAAAQARAAIAAMPLPAPDLRADRELLEALSQPVRRTGWLERLRTAFNPVSLRPLLAAGMASFAVTLGVGATLATAPVRPPVAGSSDYAEEAPTRRAEGDYEARLEEWIAEPASRLRPRRPQRFPRPAVPRKRPSERSDSIPSSHRA